MALTVVVYAVVVPSLTDAADPTGEAIQLMGNWNSQPSEASGNAGDLCCQGSSTCSSVGTCSMMDVFA